MGKKSSETKITGPWKPLQAPMKDVIQRAGDLSGQQFYADPNENIGASFQDMIARAQDPNSGIGQAVSTYAKTAGGEYLDPDSNPWLRKTFDSASDAVMDRVNAEFSKAGRYGSQAHQREMQRGLNNLAASIYAPAYSQERGLQMMAANQMPQMGIADLLQQLKGGQGLTAIDQQRMDDPRAALMQYLQMLQGVNSGPMGSKTTQSGGALGTAMGIIGGIGSAASGLGALGWNPFGAAGAAA